MLSPGYRRKQNVFERTGSTTVSGCPSKGGTTHVFSMCVSDRENLTIELYAIYSISKNYFGEEGVFKSIVYSTVKASRRGLRSLKT